MTTNTAHKNYIENVVHDINGVKKLVQDFAKQTESLSENSFDIIPALSVRMTDLIRKLDAITEYHYAQFRTIATIDCDKMSTEEKIFLLSLSVINRQLVIISDLLTDAADKYSTKLIKNAGTYTDALVNQMILNAMIPASTRIN